MNAAPNFNTLSCSSVYDERARKTEHIPATYDIIRCHWGGRVYSYLLEHDIWEHHQHEVHHTECSYDPLFCQSRRIGVLKHWVQYLCDLWCLHPVWMAGRFHVVIYAALSRVSFPFCPLYLYVDVLRTFPLSSPSLHGAFLSWTTQPPSLYLVLGPSLEKMRKTEGTMKRMVQTCSNGRL